jgi:redox-sensitive bicupin YhaK (pirin superfamily)
MFWNERIPRLEHVDAEGRATLVRVVAGALPGAGAPLAPPPDSWASAPYADGAIWTLQLAPGARWTLPRAAGSATQRMLYFFAGSGLQAGPVAVREHAALHVDATQDWELRNLGGDAVECLVLQGRPLGESVAQYGPFVMNTQAEIMQALQDYRRTQFGGWPWSAPGPVHGGAQRRFARHPGGGETTPP